MKDILKIIPCWKTMGLLSLVLALASCSADVTEVTGPSINGNTLAITTIAGDSGLPADGTSQATVRIEVFDAFNQPVDEVDVILTTTLGSLGATSVTTDANGIGTTTLTSSSVPGTAYITGTFENVSATTSIAIVNFTGSAGGN